MGGMDESRNAAPREAIRGQQYCVYMRPHAFLLYQGATESIYDLQWSQMHPKELREDISV